MKMSQVFSFIGGLLGGAIVGAAVVILLAPESGAETRQRITSKYQEIIDEGKQAIADRRQGLRKEYQTAIRFEVPIAPSEDS